MIASVYSKIIMVQVFVIVMMMTSAGGAFAQSSIVMRSRGSGGSGGNNFSNIAENVSNSIAALPGLVSGVAYLIGVLLGVLGILKIKDHVENPTQTPLKDGSVRIVSGGALFGLPIVYESALNTIGTTSAQVNPAELSAVSLGIM